MSTRKGRYVPTYVAPTEASGCAAVAVYGCFAIVGYIIGFIIVAAIWAVAITAVLVLIEALFGDISWFTFTGLNNPFN